MDTPNPIPAMAPVLSLEDDPLEGQESGSGGEFESELADLPLFPRLLPALVESARAVAGAEAAAAVVGVVEVVGRLEAGVELAEAVGEETELGGSVDGTELSLLPGSAVVGCALEEVSAEALDGATARGVLGVAFGLVDAEVED